MKLSRKLVATGALSLLTASLLAGLATTGAQGSRITLTWWDYYGPPGDADLEATFAKYEAANPNVDIRRVFVNFADLKNRLIQAAATNTLPDLMLVDNPDTTALAAQGVLEDITEYVRAWPDRAQYYPGPLNSAVYKGRTYGVPNNSNALGLFYNQNLLRQAGITAPPQTWAQLRDYAKRLTSGDRFGYCFSAVGNEEGTFQFLPYLWSAGGDLQTIGDAASVRALDFLNTLVNVDRSVSKAAVGWTQGDVYNQFTAGKCAIMANGPWFIDGLRTLEREKKVGFAWATAPYPRDRASVSILGGENLAIGKGSKNAAAAWNVIRFVASSANAVQPVRPETLRYYVPNRRDLAANQTVVSRRDPAVTPFVAAVANAKPRAYGPNYPRISEQVWTMFQSVLTGQKSAQQAARDAGAAIKPLLQ